MLFCLFPRFVGTEQEKGDDAGEQGAANNEQGTFPTCQLGVLGSDHPVCRDGDKDHDGQDRYDSTFQGDTSFVDSLPLVYHRTLPLSQEMNRSGFLLKKSKTGPILGVDYVE
jgi:hypothetical protein